VRRRHQAAQTAVIVALGLTVFAGFLALALEGGRIYLERRRLQNAADSAAMSGAWAFYSSNYAGSVNYNYPKPVSLGIAAASDRITKVISANGLAGASTTINFVDAGQAVLDTSGCPLAPCPAAYQVRGVKVVVTEVAFGTQAAGGLGITNVNVSASATAVMGPPTGAVHEAPMALMNNLSATRDLPRVSGYTGQGGSCPTNPAAGSAGANYAPPTDCRPKLGPVVLAPNYGAPPAGASPFDVAPVITFLVLHDVPTCITPCTANATTIQSGESAVMLTCPLICPAMPDPTYTYYAELTRGSPYDSDGVFAGMNARIAAAQVSNPGQDCRNPTTTPVLTSDNPRLMRLPVDYQTTPPDLGANNGRLQVSETVMFCVQDATGPASSLAPALNSPLVGYAITGYIVSLPSKDATVLTQQDQYLGQDTVVRLVN
jgi:Flp pilus assembly protein TadG